MYRQHVRHLILFQIEQFYLLQLYLQRSITILIIQVLIHEADHSPGRAGSDHNFHTECPSVRPSVPKLQNQVTITAGLDCGLAEWIIDDSCLVCI